MARILFTVMPAHGHVNPTIPLVSEFVQAGHTVDYLITEDFQRKVEYAGASFIPLKTSDSIAITGRKGIREAITLMNEKMIELAPKYDAIITGGLNPFIAHIQKEVSIPIIFSSPMFLQNDESLHHLLSKTWPAPLPIRFIALRPRLRKFISSFILSRVFGRKVDDALTIFSPQSSALNIVYTSRYFQPEEATFNEKCLYIGPTPTVSLQDETFPIHLLETSKKPIIYATLGTVFNTWTPFFKHIIDAFKGEDYLVVISTGRKETLELLRDVPDNFIIRDFVPQAEVLKHASLFITHGGMGSVSDGVSFGIPMILAPMGADQFFNSYRLQELGAGKALSKKDVTPENLKREARYALENKTSKIEMEKIRESFITSGGPSLAVKEIEKILAQTKENLYQC